MCRHIIDLYLHCSHITTKPSYCASNPQLQAIVINAEIGSHATIRPRYRTASYQSVSLIERCPSQSHPEIHSFLLCCPSCRGRFEHPKYEVVHGDRREWAHDTKRMCSRSDTKASTLPTCARLKAQAKSPARTEPPTAPHKKAALANPHGLKFNMNVQNNQHGPSYTDDTFDLSTYTTGPEPKFEIVETYLRFPLTSCHHLILFNMPETFLDESSDNILPCGCWAGKAPDTQTQEAALFIDYVGAETSFKSVWDVTGLGANGCWECGALEFEAGNCTEAEEDVGDSSGSPGHAGGGHDAAGDTRRIDTETGEVMSLKETFLADCQQWTKMEDWKDKWWNGDMAERGPKLMAQSRWGGN